MGFPRKLGRVLFKIFCSKPMSNFILSYFDYGRGITFKNVLKTSLYTTHSIALSDIPFVKLPQRTVLASFQKVPKNHFTLKDCLRFHLRFSAKMLISRMIFALNIIHNLSQAPPMALRRQNIE